jgi:hypothetical protein
MLDKHKIEKYLNVDATEDNIMRDVIDVEVDELGLWGGNPCARPHLRSRWGHLAQHDSTVTTIVGFLLVHISVGQSSTCAAVMITVAHSIRGS